MVESALGQQLHLGGPDDSHPHKLASIRNNSARQEIWVHSHEALLVHAEVGKELGVFFEVFGQPVAWMLSDGGVVKDLVSICLQDLLVFKQTALGDEQLDVLQNGVHH